MIKKLTNTKNTTIHVQQLSAMKQQSQPPAEQMKALQVPLRKLGCQKHSWLEKQNIKYIQIMIQYKVFTVTWVQKALLPFPLNANCNWFSSQHELIFMLFKYHTC